MTISENIEKTIRKKHVLKNLIEAHGWLGVITSIILFLVFWAGSISLFRAEIQQWAELPHHPVNSALSNKPLMDIIKDKLQTYPLNTKEHLSIVMPGEESPYCRIAIDLLPKEGQPDAKEEIAEIIVDPKTGETIGKAGQFQFSEFMFRLHYNINLAQIGNYIVGLVSLIFLVAIFSGVYIHWKKLFANFFSYRTLKQRTHLLDLHNLAGVISLPYILMYAVTGLIFNLIIVYQLVAVVLIYKNDAAAVFRDVGYPFYQSAEQSGVAQDMSAVIPLIEKAQSTIGPVHYLQFFNYGDQNAVIRVLGKQPNYFGHSYDIYYQVRDGVIVQQYGTAPNNAYRRGLEVVGALHFANYAGIDLRFVYFLLAMSVATMIVAGNLLWIAKRANQQRYQRFSYIIGNVTLGGCSGIILATAVGFLVERLLPAEMASRASIVNVGFTLVILISIFSSFFVKVKKSFLGASLYAAAAVIFLTLLCEIFIYLKPILALLHAGNWAVIGVDLGLLLFAIALLIIARKLFSAVPKTNSI